MAYSTAGGAVCNLYAVLAARHKFFPACKRRGMFGVPNLVMFTSEQVRMWKGHNLPGRKDY